MIHFYLNNTINLRHLSQRISLYCVIPTKWRSYRDAGSETSLHMYNVFAWITITDGAVVSLQTLGSSVTMISKSAKDGYIDDFCESVRRFAGAVSRIIIIIPQVTSSFDRLLCPVRFVTRFVIRKRTKEQVVKVIRSTVASPPRTGRSVVFARWRQCDSHLTAGCWALTQVSRSISIVSSGLAGFASVSANVDIQTTERATLVPIGRIRVMHAMRRNNVDVELKL